MAYESAYTGPQIDSAVGKVLNGQAVGPEGPAGPAGPEGPAGPAGPAGADGENGATFRPFVSDAGVLSWTNDKGLSNPEPVNIKGPPGESGTGGSAGVSSFNGRTGPVVPQPGDYTAADVGARPDTWMPSATDVGAATPEYVSQAVSGKADSSALANFLYSTEVNTVAIVTQEQYDSMTKNPKILYLIKES